MQALPRDLLEHPALWRGSQYAKVAYESIPTGHASLDAQLPGGGWPRGALTEILVDRQGIGEFSLLIPALARLSRDGDWIVLVAPPHIPYAPALSGHGVDLTKLILIHPGNPLDALWAAERCLRSKACSAVIFWPYKQSEHALCRRLQWAAEAGSAWAVAFRPRHWAQHTSPAALRLMLEADQDRLRVHLIKRRGGGGQPEILLDGGLHAARAPIPPAQPSRAAEGTVLAACVVASPHVMSSPVASPSVPASSAPISSTTTRPATSAPVGMTSDASPRDVSSTASSSSLAGSQCDVPAQAAASHSAAWRARPCHGPDRWRRQVA